MLLVTFEILRHQPVLLTFGMQHCQKTCQF